MTILYHNDSFQLHETGSHPEQPGRLRAIDSRLRELGLIEKCELANARQAISDVLARVHPNEHSAAIESLATSGGGRIDADTVVSPNSYDVARLAAGTACEAAQRVLRGDDRNALCLVRPPGHHALPQRAMGFCLYNNVAVAAMDLKACGVERILIVDWDVHHGNGTQDIFWADSQVGFLSVHRWPFWPGSGAESETGTSDGLGYTVNLPVEFGISQRDYLDRVRQRVEQFADKVRPEIVLLSAGFDAHRDDPIGSLGLETDDFRELTRIVMDVADSHCQGKLVSLLEGGYNLDALADSVAVHLQTLLGES